MATTNTLDINIGADTGEAQRSIEQLAAGVEQLASKLGGDLKQEASAVAGKLRELGAQRDAITLFQQMQQQVAQSEKNYRNLSAELVEYERQLGKSTDPQHAARIAQLRQEVSAAREQWNQSRQQH